MVLHESERNRLANDLDRVRYALEDMNIVIEGLAMLDALDTPQTIEEGRRRLVLETGIVVTYARPFSKNNIRPIERTFTADEPGYAALHRELITRRDSFYAHTDQPARSGRSIQPHPDEPNRVFVHTWPGWLPDTPTRIRDLAEAQRVWLGAQHGLIEAEIRERLKDA